MWPVPMRGPCEYYGLLPEWGPPGFKRPRYLQVITEPAGVRCPLTCGVSPGETGTTGRDVIAKDSEVPKVPFLGPHSRLQSELGLQPRWSAPRLHVPLRHRQKSHEIKGGGLWDQVRDEDIRPFHLFF